MKICFKIYTFAKKHITNCDKYLYICYYLYYAHDIIT